MSGFVPDVSAVVPDPADLGRVHLIAIGGAGMSAVARLLLSSGLAVSGSDAKDSGTTFRATAIRLTSGGTPSSC